MNGLVLDPAFSSDGRLRDRIRVDPEAGLHILRHMFLTEAGEYTDAFTLQYIALHDTIKTTMRYVHPRAESVSPGVRPDQSAGSIGRCSRHSRRSSRCRRCMQERIQST